MLNGVTRFSEYGDDAGGSRPSRTARRGATIATRARIAYRRRVDDQRALSGRASGRAARKSPFVWSTTYVAS